MFMTEEPYKGKDTKSSSRRSSSYSKESIELRNLSTLIHKRSGNYDFSTIQRLDLSQLKGTPTSAPAASQRNLNLILTSTKNLKAFEWNSLLSLNLSRNKIRRIDEGLNALSKLERLDLSYNQIKEIPKGFLNPGNNRLKYLRLEGNFELKTDAIKEVMEHLSTVVSKTLSRLSFQLRGGQDSCPLCKCEMYHSLVFDLFPHLELLDDGSVKVQKSFLKYEYDKVNVDMDATRTAAATTATTPIKNQGDCGEWNIEPVHRNPIDFKALHTNHENLKAAKEEARLAICEAKNIVESVSTIYE